MNNEKIDNSELSLDQILAIGGLGSGPYGGGDVVRWSPDGLELLVAATIGGELGLWLMPRAGGRVPAPRHHRADHAAVSG